MQGRWSTLVIMITSHTVYTCHASPNLTLAKEVTKFLNRTIYTLPTDTMIHQKKNPLMMKIIVSHFLVVIVGVIIRGCILILLVLADQVVHV